ncbi:MAG: class I SAM-dependent methyltransferase [Bacteroidota bacterium]|nr:class I SAM-dependent methyltransferase [Bacteroidota bacterium]
MVNYTLQPLRNAGNRNDEIASFVSADALNADAKTVDSFGEEWNRFASFTDEQIKTAGEQYFDIVTAEMLNENSVVLDIGCGTGRWSKFISPRVKFVEAIDPGEAVKAALPFTKSCGNVRVSQAGFGGIPFAKESFDFVFSLGVVHHLPDTQAAITEAASVVKPKGWLLLYIYYALDGRGLFFRFIFGCSDLMRQLISRFPKRLKFFACELIAIFIYAPFILLTKFVKLFGGNTWRKIPLSYYAGQPWKISRNDALDRFGTPLEKRFSKKEIELMLLNCGMKNIRFSENEPYWHVVAQK